MATFTPKQIVLENINNGNEYVTGDGIQPSMPNDVVEGVAYCNEQIQALIQPPDNSEANNVGTPTVSFSNTTVNGRVYKRFKFANLKGATGAKGDKGATGDKGDKGDTGAVFTPFVSSDGIISWTNDGELANPTSVNIKGAKGDKGDTGDTGAAGDSVISATLTLVS